MTKIITVLIGRKQSNSLVGWIYLFVGYFIYMEITDFYAENFMTGYRVVFDRERLVLGWEKFNCKYYFSFTKLAFPHFYHMNHAFVPFIQVMTLRILILFQ